MLYAYWPAGVVEWDDVVVKQVSPPPIGRGQKIRRSPRETNTPNCLLIPKPIGDGGALIKLHECLDGAVAVTALTGLKQSALSRPFCFHGSVRLCT